MRLIQATLSLMLTTTLVGLLPGSAIADGDEDVVEAWKSDWACGKQVSLSKEEMGWLEISHVSPAQGQLPAFVLARIVGDQSTMVVDKPLLLFVKDSAAWRPIAIAEGSNMANIYVSPEMGRVMFFSMWAIEGPGQEYVVTTTGDAFKNVTCGTLPSPDAELGTLDYMQIRTLNSDSKGNATLRGVVEFGADEQPRPDTWFEASTTDGGKTWSKPQKIAEPQLYEATSFADGMFDDLVEDLRKSIK